LAVLLGLLAATGCDTSPESTPPETTVGLPPQGDPSGPQPVDIYQAEMLGQVEYAHSVIRNECLVEAGYPQNLNGMVEYRPQGNYLRFRPSNHLGFTSEDEARERGMGKDQSAEPARIVSFDPSYDAALEQCAAQSWSRFSDSAQATYDAYVDLGGQVNDVIVARVRPVLRAGVAPLIECLEQAGFVFRGTPAEREGVGLLNLAPYLVTMGRYDGPSPDWTPQEIAGTVQVGPPIAALEWIPTPEEQELAVAVFRCDQQSHRIDEAWAAHYAGQVEAINRFETNFSELNPQLGALAEEASTIIASR
jgi:hypothetical protein